MSRQRQIVPTSRSILVVDDQTETLNSVAALLRSEGHRVLTANSGAKALAYLRTEPVHLILVDYFMPVMNGELLIRAIRERDPLVQIILQTGYAGENPPREMLKRLAIQGYHDKSDGPDRLLLWVDVALKTHDRLEQVTAAERTKTELLANVSHEFRTPLNVIVGYVGFLRDGTVDPGSAEGARLLETIDGNAAHLLELVENVLGLTKLESREARPQPEAVELGPFLEKVVRPYERLLRGRPVELAVNVAADLPALVTESDKLSVIVHNLLSNAVKFTPTGKITVSAEVQPGSGIAIRVRDTGPGIAPAQRDAIFELFHRAVPQDGQIRGLGLGLGLGRRLARAMGGDLVVESAVNEGSTFTLTLPAAAGACAGALEKGQHACTRTAA